MFIITLSNFSAISRLPDLREGGVGVGVEGSKPQALIQNSSLKISALGTCLETLTHEVCSELLYAYVHVPIYHILHYRKT